MDRFLLCICMVARGHIPRVAKPVGFTGFFSRFTLKPCETAVFSCAKTLCLQHRYC